MKILGIDGGASKVSGAIIERINEDTFEISGKIIELHYKDHPSFDHSFQPVDLIEQLNDALILQKEKEQGGVYIETLLNVIKQLGGNTDSFISIAMPGIKSNDKKGIQVMSNGPRLPDLCKKIQNAIEPSSNISNIESDSDMCAWGEEFAINGFFRGINNAYYIGGGTGIADGMKLNNQLLSFDSQSGWITKTWELKSSNGSSIESLISMPAINNHSENSVMSISKIFALLIFERVRTIYEGWDNQFIVERKIDKSHSYHGILLDRIVIGQRLSEYLNSKVGNNIFEQIKTDFIELCAHHGGAIKEHFLNDDRIVLSSLREAPIIGLGSKAWMEIS